MGKILIVDDEKRIVDIVKAYLEKDGFTVALAYDGKAALDIAGKQAIDLVILDLMLPEISGLDVCRALRMKTNMPIIMLTARDDVTDKIIGLELGADDYVTKPFDPKELVSRVRAVLRRSKSPTLDEPEILLGDILINVDKRLVLKNGKPVDLTPMEFDLLKVMAETPGRVYSRMQLLEKVQGNAYEGYERTIDSHIKNLRKKIELNPEKPLYIMTIYGVGYKMEGGLSA